MVEEFVEHYAKMIASFPDDIQVQSRIVDDTNELVILSNKADVGKLIGKEGKMIGAIKTVISGCKAKDNTSYRINVESI